MNHGTNARAWWLRGLALVACLGCLVAAAIVSRSMLSEPGDGAVARVVDRGHAVYDRTVYRATPSAQPGGTRFAGRSDVFGLVVPGPTPGEVFFAPARREQPGGPETVVPADIQPYLAFKLAPGAEIRVTAPIANEGVTDYVKGITVTPERFDALYKESEQRYGPIMDRGHMFELWFDGEGRIVRMIHYFSP